MAFRRVRMWVFAVVIVFCVCGYLFTATVMDKTFRRHIHSGPISYVSKSKNIDSAISKTSDWENDSAISKTSDWENSLVQRRRLHRIEETCFAMGAANRYKKPGRVHYVPEYNFSYCHVPKAGCTFVVQMVAVLRLGTESASSIFSMARKRVHQQNKLGLRLTNTAETHGRVLFARNPYSRLYSAYVDKIYLPLQYASAISVSRHANKAKKENIPSVLNDTKYINVNDTDDNKYVSSTNVTFTHFLKQIRRNVDDHWAPIASMCQPCGRQNFFLIKMETYTEDMEYLLRELSVERDKYNMLVAMLHEHRVATTIEGITKTLLINCMDGSQARLYLSHLECIRRLWVSFQIQGYISDREVFSAEVFHTLSEQQNEKYIVKIIMDTIARDPLTSEERKLQRQRALANAYRTVDDNTLSMIKQLYAADFQMFGYSLDPPSMQ